MNGTIPYRAAEAQLQQYRPYSTREDFCQLFEEQMDGLYSLALLLTGDETAAEECFLSALDDCCKSTDVFREWALSWSRRTIIKDAIRRLHPAPTFQQNTATLVTVSKASGALDRLLGLPTFERFVFAMSVLQGYSVHECAALLDCGPRDVTLARLWALRSLGAEETVPLLRQKTFIPQAMPALGAA
jgi:DNA-directed RNA polymerase specialized sigma24 family protein